MVMIGNRYHVVGSGDLAEHNRTLYGVRSARAYVQAVKRYLRTYGETISGSFESGLYDVEGLGRVEVFRCMGPGCSGCGAVPPSAVASMRDAMAKRSRVTLNARWHDADWLHARGVRV